jgi:hypothetical protein
MERTETDKILQSPVTVKIGGQDYEIKPLPIKYAVPWVKKVINLLIEASVLAMVTIDTPDLWKDAYITLMARNPAQLVDLFWEYARDLDKNKLEEVATSAEIMAAFEEVLDFELPLFKGMQALARISQ